MCLCRREPSRFHLTHLGREIGCADVHLFGDVLSDHVDHKFAGATDVAGCVFGNKRVPRPIRHAYSDDGRIGTKWWHALKGAAFSRPFSSMLVISAIGRGATRPSSNFQARLAGPLSKSKLIGWSFHCGLMVVVLIGRADFPSFIGIPILSPRKFPLVNPPFSSFGLHVESY